MALADPPTFDQLKMYVSVQAQIGKGVTENELRELRTLTRGAISDRINDARRQREAKVEKVTDEQLFELVTA